MIGWMRKGYRAAQRTYKSIDTWRVTETFIAIEEAVDAFLKRDGAQFTGYNARVRYDLWAGDATVWAINEQGRRIDW